ncbi:hypothetical protein NHX12_003325 [Muraenolepis orangiensis]|uniref:Uncharacterized protein n=1 Tax=Muraenolepis orangiensis TaxID=630683 RepID=A0A9Q0DXU5_9TELE|nr:hypothetical protein NHX12_003325 [Muraenolepis orangiensis]
MEDRWTGGRSTGGWVEHRWTVYWWVEEEHRWTVYLLVVAKNTLLVCRLRGTLFWCAVSEEHSSGVPSQKSALLQTFRGVAISITLEHTKDRIGFNH